MMQAGLNSGQWMSQFNARKICGTALAQAGPGNWCSENKSLPNYNAQLLIENPASGSPEVVSGTSTFASAKLCLANSRLDGSTYPYWKKNSVTGALVNLGIDGYKDFMLWVKGETIAGRQVTIGVLLKYGTDPQYDHEVTIIAIATRYFPITADYHDDDILYFDDHGAYTAVGNNLNKGNPAVPYGAGSPGCTPYVFGYTFGSLPQTRQGASLGSAQAYSIVIPGAYPTYTYTGGSGYTGGGGTQGTIKIAGHNYGFSVSGATDLSRDGFRHLLPIRLSITGTQTAGASNPQDPIAGWQYENSMIGTDIKGMSCTNTPPQYWMRMKLKARVGGLTVGQAYNLYEYDRSFAENDYPFDTAAALNVPTGDFNHNASMATYACSFRASGMTETFPNTDCPDPVGHGTEAYVRNSNQIVVFRAVPASAP